MFFFKFPYSSTSVLDTELFAINEIVESVVFFLFNATECVNHAVFGLDFKIERTGTATSSSKVYACNLFKSNKEVF